MILNLDNIGGIRFVPYGGTAQVSYGIPSVLIYSQDALSANGTILGWSTVVWSGRASFDTVTRHPMLPGHADQSKPLLVVDDRIYIDGARIVTGVSRGTAQYGFGGYLGTITASIGTSWFERGSSMPSASVIQSCDMLGVIHAPYSGGLRISGLNVAPAVSEASQGEFESHVEAVKWNGVSLHAGSEYWDGMIRGNFHVEAAPVNGPADWIHYSTTGATPPTP